MLSVFLSGSRIIDYQSIQRRFFRIIVPWFLWFLVYAAANFFAGKPVVNVESGWMAGVLAGPSIHLWYMPYIFLVLLLFDVVKNNFSVHTVAGLSLLSGAAMFLVGASWRPLSVQLGYPIAQWMHALPAVLFGVFIYYFRSLTPIQLGLGVFLTGWSLLMSGLDLRFGLPYLVGSAAMIAIAAGWFSPRIGFDLLPLSECTLGIYLSHTAFQKLLANMGLPPGAVLATLSFFLSLTFVFLARKHSVFFRRYMS
nr:acyltransferase family protein [Rubrivivax pictus]